MKLPRDVLVKLSCSLAFASERVIHLVGPGGSAYEKLSTHNLHGKPVASAGYASEARKVDVACRVTGFYNFFSMEKTWPADAVEPRAVRPASAARRLTRPGAYTNR